MFVIGDASALKEKLPATAQGASARFPRGPHSLRTFPSPQLPRRKRTGSPRSSTPRREDKILPAVSLSTTEACALPRLSIISSVPDVYLADHGVPR